MKKKVYCNECKYIASEYGYTYCSEEHPVYIDDPYSREDLRTFYRVKNAHNQCKWFEKK